MVKFTTIAAGGVDYYQESQPNAASNGELWLPITEATYNGTDATGVTQDWSHTLHGNDSVRRVYGLNGVVYSVSHGGFNNPDLDSVIAADASDGSKIWGHNRHDHRERDITVTNDVVYTCSQDGTVKASDTRDGSKVWSHSLHGTNVRTVDALNGVVYSGGRSGSVIAADATNGSKLWEHNHHSDRLFGIHVSNGVVYSSSGGTEHSVIAADATDGSKLWEHNLHSNTVYKVYASNRAVYSTSADGTVKAVDENNGVEIWSHSHHPTKATSVDSSNGVVYSGSKDGTFMAVDASDGSLLWSQSDAAWTVHESNGRIYTADGGQINAYDLDGITFRPDDGGTSTPQLYYNGEWLQSQNGTDSAGNSTGGSY